MTSPNQFCEVCGSPITPRSGKGKPRQYCDDIEGEKNPCREYAAAISQAEKYLEQVKLKAGPEQKKSIRSRLWLMANRLNGK